MTLDGGGGLYWGDVASADGTALVLTHNTSRAECMPGGNACVLDGTATGQCRRIISCDGRRKLRKLYHRAHMFLRMSDEPRTD